MKSIRQWQAIVVAGVYIGGIILGLVIAIAAHVQFTTHPHRIPTADIILHNWSVQGIMLLGVLSFGLVTLVTLLVNGTMFGFIMGAYALKGKLIAILLALAPHGILEISAYLLACYGDMFLVAWIWSLFRQHSQQQSGLRSKWLRKAILINVTALILLAVAGYIEHTLFLTA